MSEMTTEEKISVALKEYEALRKEIDARTDATKNYGWPVIAVAFAAAVGWKFENIDFNIASLLAPVVAMTIYALAANANYSIDKARKGLALAENRIFEISGNQVLICYESLKLRDWSAGNANKWLSIELIAPLIYVSLEVFLFALLPESSRTKIESYPPVVVLLVGIIIAPLAIHLINTFMRYSVRSRVIPMPLMQSKIFEETYQIYKSSCGVTGKNKV